MILFLYGFGVFVLAELLIYPIRRRWERESRDRILEEVRKAILGTEEESP